MGNAAERPRLVVERKKRLHKRSRRVERYSGNLIAFGRPDAAQPAEARLSRKLQSAPAPSVPIEHARSGAHPSRSKATDGDPARATFAAVADPVKRRSSALTIIGSVCAGAMVGGLWALSYDNRPATDGAPASPENTVAGLPGSSPSTTAMALPSDTAPTDDPDDAFARRLEEIGELEARNRDLERQVRSLDRRLEAIDEIEARNRDLEWQVQALDRETLELNRELLSLEMQIASGEKPPTPSTEVRVVYNFVNVPIGGSVDSGDYPTGERATLPPPSENGVGNEYGFEKTGTRTGSQVAYDPDIDSYADAGAAYDPDIDAYGNPVDGYDPNIDAYGNPVDGDDPGIDAYGNPVDGYGPGIDAYGNPVDGYDPGIDAYGNPVDAMELDEPGRELPARGARSMMR